MDIQNEKVVSIHYKLTNNEGEVLDTSEGKDPLNYIQGKQNIIPGLEKALEGKTTGDKINVTVQPAEAYGEYREEMIQQIPRTAFGEIERIEPGMQFQMNTQNGPVIVTVTKVEEENVTIDANHPLAGKELTFDVEVMEVRDASEEELSHGHVHGPDGHAH
ncbi:MAG: peptidylprolyl isomerase [Melioribacteraceae bacterium]|nr:peptidylprolyl isomerase [Melioribacteraceae bacterium]MCF8353301.1 peptidylprolyl isomerase [Melioribacteraceae bacterium]MCF8395416.1 peptidylprolyl isomerase [Melioribacteraceae bacterium]MCF8418828.1 peptidylprolyl isomerase [Melioribacteraceae bacterium]